MLTKLKSALGNLLGGSGGGQGQAPSVAVVDYNGFRIIPAPYKAGAQFQLAGAIEKDTEAGVKRHEFVRADTYMGWDDAVTYTTLKAKQIIDLQGDRIFD